jgi:hypothetical protein
VDIDTSIILRGHVTLSDHIVQTVVDLCSLHSRKETGALLSRVSKLCSCLCYQCGVANTLQSRGRRSASRFVTRSRHSCSRYLCCLKEPRSCGGQCFISRCSLLTSDSLHVHLEHCKGLPALQSKNTSFW